MTIAAQIIDGADIARATLVDGVTDPRSLLLACYPTADIQPFSWTIPSAAPMVAEINHGVWVASCECGATGVPAPGCVVFLDQPRGWCVRCGNRRHGGFWRPIALPSPGERRRIEAVLLCRPNVGDRNWQPGETVADLVAQNREHGDPVPHGDEPPAPSVPMPRPSRFPPAAAMAAVLRRLARPGRR